MFYIFITIELLVFCQQLITINSIPVEHKINANSKQEFENSLKEAITEIRTVLATRTQKFDGMSHNNYSFNQFLFRLFYVLTLVV